MTYVGVSGSPAANWFRPAAYGLGQPTPTLSAGQFGLAMSRITIPAEAVRLLRLSSTFRGIAQTLDGAYVDHRRWIELREKNPGLKLNQQLRVASLLKSILLGTGLGTLVKQFPILQSPAAQAAFVLRVVDESWRELIAAVDEKFPAFPGVKERRFCAMPSCSSRFPSRTPPSAPDSRGPEESACT